MELHQTSMGIYRRAQYQYGDGAPCYIPPKMMEEALQTSLRDKRFDGWTYDNSIVDEGVVVKHDMEKCDYSAKTE